MKKYIVLLVTLTMFTGCTASVMPNQKSTVTETTTITETSSETSPAEISSFTETTTEETTAESLAETTEETTTETTVEETTTTPVTTTTVATTTTVPVTTTTVATTTTAPVTTTTVATTTPAPISLDDYAYRVYEIVNEKRESAGLEPLEHNAKLCEMANVRAEEISRLFSHDRPDGSLCFDILDEYGYRYRCVGENIAAWQTSPEQVMESWMNSPGHKANILDYRFGQIGVGVYQLNGRYYWVQIFSD